MENTVTPQWYVVQTFSGHENAVKQSLTNMVENNIDLQDLIFDIAVPTEEDIVEKNGKKNSRRSQCAKIKVYDKF